MIWSFLTRPFAPTWQAYDAGTSTLWISDLATVDKECRVRAHGAEDQRTDKIRGCTDFRTKEIFAIDDPGVIAHELHHLTLDTLDEGPVDPINKGAAPVEPPPQRGMFGEDR